MSGAWRLNPFTRIQEWVGEFEEPGDDELKEFGFDARLTRTYKHGTEGGYNGHKRRDEKPCGPCRDAYNEASRARRARSRANRKDAA